MSTPAPRRWKLCSIALSSVTIAYSPATSCVTGLPSAWRRKIVKPGPTSALSVSIGCTGAAAAGRTASAAAIVATITAAGRRDNAPLLRTSPRFGFRLTTMRFGKDAKTELISRAPLFSECSKGELQEIAGIADEIDIGDGRELTTEGSPGREFFVIIEGTASVAQDGEHINDLGPGDFFGEVALVKDTPRTATVTATSPVRALVVTGAELQTPDRAPAGHRAQGPEGARRPLSVAA